MMLRGNSGGGRMVQQFGLIRASAEQQAAIAGLGLSALTATDASALLREAADIARRMLGIDICKVVALMPGGDELLLVAAAGLYDAQIGVAREPADDDSLIGYTLRSGGDVVVMEDLAREMRFRASARLARLGAISGMSTAIYEGDRPWGVLGAYMRRHRQFAESEVAFLRALANILSAFLTRMKMEADQAESERRHRHTVESLGGVPYVYDETDQRYVYVAPQVLPLTGYPAEYWLADPDRWIEPVHPDDRAMMATRYQALVDAGQPFEIEYRMICADGRIIWVKHFVRMEIAENGHTLLYGFAFDNTEGKEREHQLVQAQKMEALGKLTGGVAHDFNNLLAIIIGTAELLRGRDDMSAAAHELRNIESAAERGAQLAHQLLTFGRRQALNPAPIDVDGLIEDMMPLLKSTVGDSIGIKFRKGKRIGYVLTDRTQLENALLNLVINARDAMPRGGKVIVKTAEQAIEAESYRPDDQIEPGSYVVVSIGDSGPGMTPEIRARALDPFFTTKAKGKGSGLGLSVIYGFAKQTGGHLAIDSTPDHGTTVRLYLPRTEFAPAIPDIRRHVPDTGARRILVVEDEPGVRQIILAMLEKLGHTVCVAADAQMALEVLDEDPAFDLVLTDIVMPGGISGWDLAQEVRERWPQIRVVLSTGYSEDVVARDSRPGQSLRVIAKPYRKGELARTLREEFAAAE
jgi:PAS domain S-box-containing protein